MVQFLVLMLAKSLQPRLFLMGTRRSMAMQVLIVGGAMMMHGSSYEQLRQLLIIMQMLLPIPTIAHRPRPSVRLSLIRS